MSEATRQPAPTQGASALSCNTTNFASIVLTLLVPHTLLGKIMIREIPIPSINFSICRYMLLGLLLMSANQAIAELMLYPTRLVIEGNQRTAQVQLINNGADSTTYRISLINQRMNEDGSFSSVTTALPGEQFADEMLLFSPRQITLAPGATQTVRIMVRKPSGLAEGEYRSHMLFSQQPEPAVAGTDIETRDVPVQVIGVTITALISASIPVIVRHGEIDAEVKLSHLELLAEEHGPFLALWMERSGERSVYGNLTVTFRSQGGAETVIARANGVAVYYPNFVRQARLALLLPDGLSLGTGTLHVTFEEPAQEGSKVLADAWLPIP